MSGFLSGLGFCIVFISSLLWMPAIFSEDYFLLPVLFMFIINGILLMLIDIEIKNE